MLFSLLCFLFTFAKVQIISVIAKIIMLIIINVLPYFQNTSIGYLPISFSKNNVPILLSFNNFIDLIIVIHYCSVTVGLASFAIL